MRVLTSDNYAGYIEVPFYISEKLKNGEITIAHFSDIVRMKVLKRYGGLWLDATILVCKPIPDDIYQMKYYTGKMPERFSKYCVSNYRWNGSVLCGTGFPFFSFADECFMEYWRVHSVLIDYFLIDYVTAIAYEHFNWFKTSYEKVALNNPDIFNLVNKMNLEFNPSEYNNLCKNTTFFKLNWKSIYVGGRTYYSYLKQELNWSEDA